MICNLSFSTDHDKLNVKYFTLSGSDELKTEIVVKLAEEVAEFELDRWDGNKCILSSKIDVHEILNAMVELGWRIDHMAMSLHPTSPTNVEVHAYIFVKKGKGIFSS